MTTDDRPRPGELERVKAAEDAARKNIQAMLEHGNESRRLVRDLEERVKQLQRQIRQQYQAIQELKRQLNHVRQKVYAGGTA